MKKWMMLLGGWLIFFALINLIPVLSGFIPILARINMKIPNIALSVTAIVAGLLVFLDK